MFNFDGAEELFEYDYILFTSLERISGNEYYGIKACELYPIIDYSKDGFPIIFLPIGELYDINQYELHNAVFVEGDSLFGENVPSQPHDFIYPSIEIKPQQVINKEITYYNSATRKEMDQAVKDAEEILINHTIDKALESIELKPLDD